MGHEYCGIVEEVGKSVNSVKPGQFVIGSFFASDNTCPHCRAGYQTSCEHREFVGGAQAPLLRIPLADGTLVGTPEMPPNDLVPSLLAPSDVMGTGWFAAQAANVKPEATVTVVGDGADSVLECVGTQESMTQAIECTRPGGSMGYVGVPHGVELDGQKLFFAHVHLHDGPAPVRRFLPKLIEQAWDNEINPGKVFDLTLPLDQVAEGYRAMDERRAIKALLRP
jgi:threonine dehydrogenase-like Zn-dependent dehydrogenase